MLAPTKICLLMLGIAAPVAAPQARAAVEDSETVTVTIATADLDLGTEAGRNRMHRRITSAARQVCGWEARGAGEHARTLACREAAMAAARAQAAALGGTQRPQLAFAADGGRRR